MSLPAMDSQLTLFGSVPAVAGPLFSEEDRYRLFARKVWPVLARTRAALEKCYCPDNRRPGVEPVLLMGVLVLPAVFSKSAEAPTAVLPEPVVLL